MAHVTQAKSLLLSVLYVMTVTALNSKAIYHADYRIEPYVALENIYNNPANRPDWWTEGALEITDNMISSTVVLVPNFALVKQGSNWVPTTQGTAESQLNFCPEERFSDQNVIPSAFCSGIVLASSPPVLATALHCITESGYSIEDITVLFRYELLDKSGTNLIFDESDVYSITEVLLQGSNNATHDYVLLQLDRDVQRKQDRFYGGLVNACLGDVVTLIGYPYRLPKKVDIGQLSLTGAVIEANVDAYQGNSGSPVFNSDGELIGLLVRGSQDFVIKNGCLISNVCPRGPNCTSEKIIPICTILEHLGENECGTKSCGGDGYPSNNYSFYRYADYWIHEIYANSSSSSSLFYSFTALVLVLILL